MNKQFRRGQILKVITAESISSQDELRKRLVHLGVRVTQATLSRDIHELNLVKTPEGYRSLSFTREEEVGAGSLARVLRQFLLDMRAAQNLLVLKTPPGGASTLAAALDAEHWKEVIGSVAGDNTILIITASRKASRMIQQRIEEKLR